MMTQVLSIQRLLLDQVTLPHLRVLRGSMMGCGVSLTSVMKTPVSGLPVVRSGLLVSRAGRDD